jgi:hypothetical protein
MGLPIMFLISVNLKSKDSWMEEILWKCELCGPAFMQFTQITSWQVSQKYSKIASLWLMQVRGAVIGAKDLCFVRIGFLFCLKSLEDEIGGERYLLLRRFN